MRESTEKSTFLLTAEWAGAGRMTVGGVGPGLQLPHTDIVVD